MTTEERGKAFEIVKKNLKEVRDVVERDVTLEDIEGCAQKLLDLIRISGNAAHCESVAKSLYDEDVAENIEILAISAAAEVGKANLKTIAQGKAAKFLGQANYAERMGRYVSHGIEGMRSIVSLQKMELEQARFENPDVKPGEGQNPY